ncbi:MAG TPA: Ig-like domain-containing protein, partial [Ignavibacteria bacterium]|nr:Ig-like domain-containing protein [Ignavibacteria bacterium]HMR41898.1 Ig-like domain-containing protein [Ignavibacteria bacterium]
MKNSFLKIVIGIVCILNSAMSYSTPINQYINTVTPYQNAVSVNKASNITIVFTQDMNPATINNANIKVFGYQTGLLPVTIDYNAAGKTANINPNQDLKAGEKISITLTSGVKTIASENISPFVYTFYIQATGGNGIFTRTSGIDNITDAVIRSGDVNRDGFIDLVVNNKIYNNDGNAGFTFTNELPLTGIPELADFDNDGDLDILLENSGIIYFYSNNGFGNFTQQYSFIGQLGDFGDLDGDGYLDIASFLSNAEIGTFNNDQGIFGSGYSFIFTG